MPARAADRRLAVGKGLTLSGVVARLPAKDGRGRAVPAGARAPVDTPLGEHRGLIGVPCATPSIRVRISLVAFQALDQASPQRARHRTIPKEGYYFTASTVGQTRSSCQFWPLGSRRLRSSWMRGVGGIPRGASGGGIGLTIEPAPGFFGGRPAHADVLGPQPGVIDQPHSASSRNPGQAKDLPRTRLVDNNSPGPNAKYFAHALGPRIQFRVPQRAADELGSLILLDVEVDETVARVAPSTLEEAGIEAKEGRPVQRMQQRKDVLVLDSPPANLDANPANRQPPAS